MNEIDAKVVIALVQNGMYISAAARSLMYHRNTIRYHIEQIRIKTGLDPRNFFDLGELYMMAREVLGEDFKLKE